MKVRSNLTFCLAAVALAVSGPVAAVETIEIWGSTTCQKVFLEPGNEALKAATGVDVKVVGVGTGKGLLALLEGKVPASASSSDRESTIGSARKAAKDAGQTIEIPADLQYHEVARDVIVPVVHQDNPVKSLSWAQLKDIATGKVSNWKDLGGDDLAIRVVTSHAGSATRAVFQELVMNKEPYAAGAVEVKSTREELNEVSKYRGAIGAVSESFFKQNPGKTAVVQTEPVSRPLALLTVGAPTPAVEKVLAFYRSSEGQAQFK